VQVLFNEQADLFGGVNLDLCGYTECRDCCPETGGCTVPTGMCGIAFECDILGICSTEGSLARFW